MWCPLGPSNSFPSPPRRGPSHYYGLRAPQPGPLASPASTLPRFPLSCMCQAGVCIRDIAWLFLVLRCPFPTETRDALPQVSLGPTSVCPSVTPSPSARLKGALPVLLRGAPAIYMLRIFSFTVLQAQLLRLEGKSCEGAGLVCPLRTWA